MIDYWDYDESSPSCLRWAKIALVDGKGGAERKTGSIAGSKQQGATDGWAVQITENGERFRTTARRVVWEKHNGPIPPNHVIVHSNLDKYDNRIGNLICIDSTVNNLWKMWCSGKAHIQASGDNSFHSCTRVRGKYIPIRTCKTKEAAHKAYRAFLFKQLMETPLFITLMQISKQ